MDYQQQLQKQKEEYTKKLNNLFSIQPVPTTDKVKLSDLSRQKREYLKEVKLQSYLQDKKLQKLFSPFSDTDRDYFVNVLDCYPFDSSRHGIRSWLRKAGEKLGIVKPKVEPEPKLTPKQQKLAKELWEKAATPEAKAEAKKAEEIISKRRIVSGGYSRISPAGKPEYVLPSGEVVPATKETKEAIIKGAETKAEVKKLTEAQKLAPKVKAQVPVGAAVVSLATPWTAEQIKKSKEFEKELRRGKIAEKIKEKWLFLASALPRIDLTRRYGYGYKAIRPPVVIEQIPAYPRRETIPYKAPTIEELEKLGFIERATELKIAQETMKETARLEGEREKIQEKLKEEKITYESAVEELERKRKETEERLKKKQEKIIKEAKKKIEKREYVPRVASAFATGVMYGGITALAPPVGYAALGLGVGELIIKREEVKKYAKEYPLTFWSELGAGFVGGMAGGIAGGLIKGKIVAEPRIREAINKSKIKIEYKQLKTTKQIKKLDITSEGKAYLQQLLNRGNILRRATARLEPTSSADAKILPNVKSEFIEVLSRDGRIVDRISLGSFVAKYKGKVFSRGIIGDAIGKLEGGTGRFFSRTLVFKPKGKFKPVEYYEFLEKAKPEVLYRRGRYVEARGRARLELLKEVRKPRVEDITRILRIGRPTEEQVTKILKGLRGKPYARGEYVYAGKELAKRIELLYGRGYVPSKYQQMILGRTAIEYGAGRGVFERILIGAKKLRRTKPLTPLEKTFRARPQKIKVPKIKAKTFTKHILGKEEIYLRKFPAPYQMPSITQEAITFQQAYRAVPKLARPSALRFSLQSFLIGGVGLKPKMQFQINLKKLIQTRTREKITAKPKVKYVSGLVQPISQKQAQIQLQKLNQAFSLRKPAPTKPPFVIPEQIITPLPYFRMYEMKARRKKLTKEERKLREQARAYQASVGAALLGLTISPKEIEKLKKKYTGFELRPIILS